MLANKVAAKSKPFYTFILSWLTCIWRFWWHGPIRSCVHVGVEIIVLGLADKTYSKGTKGKMVNVHYKQVCKNHTR